MSPLKPSDWETLVPPGSRLLIGSGAACPQALVAAMLNQSHRLKDIEIVHILTVGPCPWIDEQYRDTFTTNSFFQSPGVRDAVNKGQADYTPCFLSEIPKLFTDGILPVDVVLVQVTPPDEYGFCSLGVSVDVIPSACRSARTIIAQINPAMPRTLGQSFIHVRQIAAFLEAEAPIPEVVPDELTDEISRIGGYVAQLIEDGSTLQLGIGRIPNAILRSLGNHRHLGLHTEVISDGVLACLESGAIDNSRKPFHPGKTITSFCLGSRRLYDYVHNNPHVEFHPTEYVNSPLNIAKNPKVVAINGALEVDLTGQVVADSIGYQFYSGIGGQVDFIRGAAMSPGGKPIVALPSTAHNGEVSRIVPHLAEGAGVVTSRGDVHYVVTEYGVATLRGRTIRERALELIQVAHPKFRDSLLRAACERRWVPSYQQAWPREVKEFETLEVRKIQLKGEPYVLRPLHPSDQRRLQEFFYSHSEETIEMRYGYAINRMSRERAYELVNINQSQDLALAIFEVQGPREIIHAVGRFYRDPKGGGAEVAFVVREEKRRLGMASVLLETMVEIARRRKLQFLWGRVRKANLPMLSLFRRFGGKVLDTDQGTDVDVRIPLDKELAKASRTGKARKSSTSKSKRSRKS